MGASDFARHALEKPATPAKDCSQLLHGAIGQTRENLANHAANQRVTETSSRAGGRLARRAADWRFRWQSAINIRLILNKDRDHH
jgi:hypothetical protein